MDVKLAKTQLKTIEKLIEQKEKKSKKGSIDAHEKAQLEYDTMNLKEELRVKRKLLIAYLERVKNES